MNHYINVVYYMMKETFMNKDYNVNVLKMSRDLDVTDRTMYRVVKNLHDRNVMIRTSKTRPYQYKLNPKWVNDNNFILIGLLKDLE